MSDAGSRTSGYRLPPGPGPWAPPSAFVAAGLLQRPSSLDGFILAVALLHAARVFATPFELLAPNLPLSTALWLLLYGWVVIAICARHGARWIPWALSKDVLLSTVVATALASVAWSLAPELTVQRSVHLLGSTLIALYLGYHFPPRSLISLLSWVFGILIVGGALSALALPQYGQQDYGGTLVWRGLEGNKNTLGMTATIAAIFFGVRAVTERTRRLWWFALALLSILAIVMADSATSLAALLFGVLVVAVFAFTTILRLPPAIALFAMLLSGAGAVALVLTAGLDQFIGTMGRSTLLTGRTELWALVWEITRERPWLGYGYGALWFPKPGTEAMQQEVLGLTWAAYHAHSGFLGVAAELGIPAAILAMAYALHALALSVRFYARSVSPFALFGIGFQCAFLVSNVAEARMLIDRNLHWLLFVAVSVALLRSAERRRWVCSHAGMSVRRVAPAQPAGGAGAVAGARHGVL